MLSLKNAAPNRRVPGGHMKRKAEKFITPDKRRLSPKP